MKRIRLYLFVVFCLFLSNTQLVKAQQPSYTVIGEDELNGVNIYSLLQDANGAYWIATDHGLYRLDGRDIQSIPLGGANSRSLFDLKTDHNGTIHCKNLAGQIFQVVNDSCQLLIEIDDDILSSDMRYAFDEHNRLVVVTRNLYTVNDYGKLYQIDSSYSDGLFSEFYVNDDATLSIYNTTSTEFVHLTNGTLHTFPVYVEGHGRQINQFQLNDSMVFIDATRGERFVLKGDSLISLGRISALGEGQLVRTHVGNHRIFYELHSGGAFVTNTFHKIRYRGEVVFKNSILSAFLEDKDGNVLLGTFGEGIFYLSPYSITSFRLPNHQERPSKVTVSQDGEVFVGSQKGRIYRFDVNGQPELIEGGLGKNVEVLEYFDASSILLYDGREPVFYYLEENATAKYIKGSIKDVQRVSENRYLFSTNNGMYDFHIPQTKQQIAKPAAIDQGRTYCGFLNTLSQTYYIGTAKGLKLKRDDTVSYVMHQGQNIQATDISARGNRVLVATQENGVFVFENDQIAAHWNAEAGLISNNIRKMYIGEALIYLATSEGMQTLTMEGEPVQIIGKSEGLAAKNVIDFAQHGDELWVVHQKGLQRVVLSDIPAFDFTPDIDVEMAVLSDQNSLFNSTVTQAQFDLQSFNLKYREEITFEYRLLGFDPKWQKSLANQHVITYRALPPGKYVFEARAVCRDNKSEVQKAMFTVEKAFWEEGWFILLMLLLFGLFTYVIYSIQIKKHRRKVKLKNELNASKLIAIQSQMNPHFIFNAINSIQDLILKGDIDNSYSYIIKFSQLVRKTLDFSREEFIDIDEEVELLKIYLDLESLRFNEEFEYSIKVENCVDIMVPPMLVQPLVENAIKHGLLHKDGSKKLEIRFELKDKLYCWVKDNGVGRETSFKIKQRQSSGHESFSVGAIKSRIEIMQVQYNEFIGVNYTDLEADGRAAGTLVEIVMPFKQVY